MKFEVGQELLFVPCRLASYGSDQITGITRVGMRWLELSNGLRVDIKTLEADGKGGPSPGRCYLSREVWRAECELNTAWALLRQKLYDKRSIPDGITLEHIRQAAELLKMPVFRGENQP